MSDKRAIAFVLSHNTPAGLGGQKDVREDYPGQMLGRQLRKHQGQLPPLPVSFAEAAVKGAGQKLAIPGAWKPTRNGSPHF